MPDDRGDTRAAQQVRAPLQLWGGIEATHNRVGDRYFSQLDRSGHHARLADIDRCAELGIRTLRYPVLWERTMPDPAHDPDWGWSDERLARLRELGIEPIVGLLHHGSGPRHTSLVDPRFADKLADYAARVARRYPWVDHYTPVNEPLTTALFSGLYGVWYPHQRSDRAFTTALLAQCRGVVLAMRAIRATNPHATLVQTDDLGATYSTPLLRDQARFNNERRWLTWDLLCGTVDRHHPLWNWLIACGGATEAELMWFAEHPCPPDVVGVNHYVTSERYITEDLHAYDARYHGGNGRLRYADVEAVRCLERTAGIRALLAQAWTRYRLPLAVTEAHIDSTREDQLRWIVEIWRAAEAAKRAGADVRAVTLWALFGTYDWNCLATECHGYYESGAFDARMSPPRPTAIAALARSLATGIRPSHPVLPGPGWWQRPGRFYAGPVDAIDAAPPNDGPPRAEPSRPVLITGATGTLGRAFARICTQRGLAHVLLGRRDLDIADADAVDAALAAYEPWAVVNAAGYVRVDDAESEVDLCYRENTVGAQNLARACARDDVALITFSTDLVFDGERDEPYVESDPTSPLNVYGRSKAEAECRVLDCHPAALVIRTSAFFGPWDEYNYVTLVLRALRAGQPFRAAADLVVSPTYVPDLVNTSLDLLIDKECGIWHLTNGEAITWAELAMRAADVARLSAHSLVSCNSAALDFVARRPRYSALTSNRSTLMPSLKSSLERYAILTSHAPAR
jgi:dTDP-4-dehydrorhamnose reductase